MLPAELSPLWWLHNNARVVATSRLIRPSACPSLRRYTGVYDRKCAQWTRARLPISLRYPLARTVVHADITMCKQDNQPYRNDIICDYKRAIFDRWNATGHNLYAHKFMLKYWSRPTWFWQLACLCFICTADDLAIKHRNRKYKSEKWDKLLVDNAPGCHCFVFVPAAWTFVIHRLAVMILIKLIDIYICTSSLQRNSSDIPKQII
jgi:hypothetical protein